MSAPQPIALSDDQITTIMALARPLAPDQRTAFVELLITKLNGRREIGDGALYQLCRELQRELLIPPLGTDDDGNARRVRTNKYYLELVRSRLGEHTLSAHTPGLSLNDAADRGKPWQPWSITISTLGICHKTYLQRSG
jgi:hypothetical protein